MIDYYVIVLVDLKGSGIRLELKSANHAEKNIRIIGLPQSIDLICKNEESSRHSDLLPPLFPAHLSVLLRIRFCMPHCPAGPLTTAEVKWIE